MNKDPVSSFKNVRECLLCMNPMYTVHENENMICDSCHCVQREAPKHSEREAPERSEETKEETVVER